MKTLKGVKKYAKQFLNAVGSEDASIAIKHLNTMTSVLQKDKKLKTMFINPAFSDEEITKALSAIASKIGMSEKTTKFLHYLYNNHAMHGLPEIVKNIEEQYMLMQKRARATVISPTDISAQNSAKIAEALSKVTGKKVELNFIKDPSLIGGIKIQIGSVMYDSSIKGQLELLKAKLIKG